MLDVEVYLADWESRKWLAYYEPQKPHRLFSVVLICLDCSISRREDPNSRDVVMFVCLARRPVHIEVTHQIDTDWFK